MIRNLTLLVVAVFFAIVVGEAALQAFPALLPERHEYLAHRVANQNARSWLDWTHRDEPHVHHEPSDTFRHHQRFGWTSTPDLERTVWGYDGHFDVETNSDGFRDGEFDGRDERPRVLVLGDSFVWGLFLDNDELMPQQLERELAAGGRDVDVVNAGMAGFGTDQELLVLREFGPRVEPTLVVLAFFYSNDFEDNARATSRWRGGRSKPYFEIGAGGELELKNQPVPLVDRHTSSRPPPNNRTPLERELRKRSVLVNLIASTSRRPQRERPGSGPDSNARALTRELILEAEREAERLGAPLIVTLFPGYGFSRGRRLDYERAVEFFSTELPNIELFDLTPAFEETEGPLHGRFVEHWNAAGAKLAARELAAHLVRHHSGPLAGES